MNKSKAQSKLNGFWQMWPGLSDNQRTEAWEQFDVDMKNAVHVLFGIDGLPLVVQLELQNNTEKEAPHVPQAVIGSGEGGDTLPAPDTSRVPLLAELTAHDKLLLRPVYYSLWDRLDSMVVEPVAESEVQPVIACVETVPVYELPPDVLECLEGLGKYTVEEADVVKSMNKTNAGMLFDCFATLCCVCVMYLVLCS